MSSWHEQALDAHIESLLAKDPQWSEFLTQVQRRMNGGAFSDVDDVVQYAAIVRKPYTYADAYVMANIHGALYEHKIARLTITMPLTAPPDKNLEAVAEVFQGKMAPFVLEMWGGYGDQDGILSWDRPVRAYLPGYEPTEASGSYQQSQQVQQIRLPPGHIPLEVGSTLASRSWFHLLQDGGLARWPYESNEIHVYVVLQNLIDSEMYAGRMYPTVELLEAEDTNPYIDVSDDMRWAP